MNLKQYIKNNYKNPNPRILETLGASEVLINYLKFTPWNTNMAIISSLASSSTSGVEPVVGTAVVGTAVI